MFWVYGGIKNIFIVFYWFIVDILDLFGCYEFKVDVFVFVCDWFYSVDYGLWLFIFDNVDDVEIFFVKDELVLLVVYLLKVGYGKILVIFWSLIVVEKFVGIYRDIMRFLKMDNF